MVGVYGELACLFPAIIMNVSRQIKYLVHRGKLLTVVSMS